MFPFKQIKLSKNIHAMAIETSDVFYGFLKNDVLIDKCIDENSLKVYTAIFIINIYRDILNRKYDEKTVYLITKTAINTLASEKLAEEQFTQIYFDIIKLYNNAMEYYETQPDHDPLDAITKIYFSIIISDREFLKSELDRSIPLSNCYKNIYRYINHTILGNN